MFAFHGVTKIQGRGAGETIVLDDVDWQIRPREKYVILGQKGSGKTTLLALLSGAQIPTSGWIERRGVVSSTTGFARLADNFTSSRVLVDQLAPLYGADNVELARFVGEFAGLGDEMDVPIRMLTPAAKQKLNLALFYGLPCDLYLFDERIETRLADIEPRRAIAFRRRRREAAMILATSNVRTARENAGTVGLLFRGKIRIFDSPDQAFAVFQNLPPVPTATRKASNRIHQAPAREVEED